VASEGKKDGENSKIRSTKKQCCIAIKEKERKINLEKNIIGGGIIAEQRMNSKIFNSEVQHMSEREGNKVWSGQEKLQWYLM